MRLDELGRLRKLLTDATSPEDVFMSLRDRSLRGDAQSLALAAEVRRLQSIANPERFMGNPPAQDVAREIQARLAELQQAALASLAAPATPEAPAVPEAAEPPAPAPVPWRVDAGPTDAPRFELAVEGRRYAFDRLLAHGDVATLHRGRGVAGEHAGREVVAKLARDRADNELVLAEVAALRRLQRGDAAQRGQVPAALDLFGGPDGQAGAVLTYFDGLTAAELRARLPAGVPPEHVVWIGRRLLSVAGMAHQHGIVHANIEPAHVIVRPHDHHVALIDWCWSVTEPARTHQGFRVHNADYSAPEVAEKKPPLPAADLYSIGRVLLFLLGGDLRSGVLPETVDDRLQRFVRYLTRPSPLQRAQDAWEMFRELERTRAAIYGAHRFRELVV